MNPGSTPMCAGHARHGPLAVSESSRLAVLSLVEAHVHEVAGGDERLALVYRHTEFHDYPSRYEGFGMPSIEALLAFFDFPAEHWTNIRSINPFDLPFATIRHRRLIHFADTRFDNSSPTSRRIKQSRKIHAQR